MRKQCRRRVWPTPSIPVTFCMTKAGLDRCSLLSRSALEALVAGEGTGDHIAQLKQVAFFCARLCTRLEADVAVDLQGLVDARTAILDGLDAIDEARDGLASKRECSTGLATRIAAMLDANEALDKVSTRRQSRDSMLELFEAMQNEIIKEANHGQATAA